LGSLEKLAFSECLALPASPGSAEVVQVAVALPAAAFGTTATFWQFGSWMGVAPSRKVTRPADEKGMVSAGVAGGVVGAMVAFRVTGRSTVEEPPSGAVTATTGVVAAVLTVKGCGAESGLPP
jgi:hypothetical protein